MIKLLKLPKKFNSCMCPFYQISYLTVFILSLYTQLIQQNTTDFATFDDNLANIKKN